MNWEQTFANAKQQLNEETPSNFLIYRIPSGVYNVVFDGMIYTSRTSEPKIPYFVIKMHIADGDFKGFILNDVIGFSDTYATRGLARIMALAECLHIDIDNASSPEELSEIMNTAIKGYKCRVLAVKSRGQKAVINYLFDNEPIKYTGSDATHIDFDYDNVPDLQDSPIGDTELNEEEPEEIPF